MEDRFPGMWQRWFKHQAVAVGWYSGWGFCLNGSTRKDRGWPRARKALLRIQVGDQVVAALSGHRVGRVGTVVGMAVEDDEWEPLVPGTPAHPDGEMGRRILVRWNLLVGPDDRELVVSLPEGDRFTQGELRPTIAEIQSMTLARLEEVMNDRTNWSGLIDRFRYEKALSSYIASYPHRLEDGLLPHPDAKVRERIFPDRSRLDVLLIDRQESPVIVECKQNQPSSQDLAQLRHYMKHLEKETGRTPRGILVHGGARKISQEVLELAREHPRVEVVQYRVEVDFAPSV